MSGNYKNDILLWPCGTWCYREKLHEYEHKFADDFEVIPFASKKWCELNYSEKEK